MPAIEIAEPISLDGTISSLDVFEDTPTRVTNVVDRTKPWGVRISWEMLAIN